MLVALGYVGYILVMHLHLHYVGYTNVGYYYVGYT
jgi:hypothetical protein